MNKFNAKPTTIDNVRFASAREARRYQELLVLERAGAISQLELQPRYPIVINGIRVTTYVADFRYVEAATGRQVVEDSKGYRTREYRLKSTLMAACHGIEIAEV